MTKSNFISLLATGHNDSHDSDKAAIKTRKTGDKKVNDGSDRWDAILDDYLLTSRSSLKVCFVFIVLCSYFDIVCCFFLNFYLSICS